MREQSLIAINGLNGTFLQKGKYLRFEECIKHKSLIMHNALQQRNLTIYKYIPLKYLLVLLKEKKLILKTMSSWEDPYENFFMKNHFIKSGWDPQYIRYSIEDKAKYFFGMSWTLQKESDSMWRIYSPDKMSVRISSTVEYLAETMCSEDDTWTILMDKVKYKSEDEIQQWLNSCKKLKSLEQFSQKLADSFFIKRNAFSAEEEYRIVVKKETDNKSSFVCFEVNPEEMISSILVDPRVSEYEFEAIKASLMSFGVDSEKISQSNLYSFNPQVIELGFDLFHSRRQNTQQSKRL